MQAQTPPQFAGSATPPPLNPQQFMAGPQAQMPQGIDPAVLQRFASLRPGPLNPQQFAGQQQMPQGIDPAVLQRFASLRQQGAASPPDQPQGMASPFGRMVLANQQQGAASPFGQMVLANQQQALANQQQGAASPFGQAALANRQPPNLRALLGL
jgi:hypothetical protein